MEAVQLHQARDVEVDRGGGLRLAALWSTTRDDASERPPEIDTTGPSTLAASDTWAWAVGVVVAAADSPPPPNVLPATGISSLVADALPLRLSTTVGAGSWLGLTGPGLPLHCSAVSELPIRPVSTDWADAWASELVTCDRLTPVATASDSAPSTRRDAQHLGRGQRRAVLERGLVGGAGGRHPRQRGRDQGDKEQPGTTDHVPTR